MTRTASIDGRDDLSKREYAMLEKMFSAEIDAAITSQPIRGVFQSSSKLLPVLKDKGMVTEVELTLPGRPFPVTVRGWALTPLGHLTYCMSC